MAPDDRRVAAGHRARERAHRAHPRHVGDRRGRQGAQRLARVTLGETRRLQQRLRGAQHRHQVVGGEHRAGVVAHLGRRRHLEGHAAQRLRDPRRGAHRLPVALEREGRAAEPPRRQRRVGAHGHERVERAHGRAGPAQRRQHAGRERAGQMQHHAAGEGAVGRRELAHGALQRVVAHRQQDDVRFAQPRGDVADTEAYAARHGLAAPPVHAEHTDAGAPEGEREPQPCPSRPDDADGK
ncbi:MAG: hypothetical protein A2085_11130 [Gemmatimonadetes bacterium GWC2_71_10]|nr:MAG: hypothetical protein A2085_11130 [Gemmatimonadetes bacterium GWC2_71_10]